MDISVVLPVVNERENLSLLLPRLKSILEREKLSYEILVIDGNSTDGTGEFAASMGARVMPERRRGYAGALMTGLAEARGDYILTLDADMSHDPDFVTKMWRARTRGDIVVASRYVRGGVAYSGWVRRRLSDVLNFVLRRMLSVPIGDLSSGFRLYRREAVANLDIESKRGSGRSHARVIAFGIDLARSAVKLWKVRNSLDSADYDERAFYSIILPQRYWQRRRHSIVLLWARGFERILDAGCGSSVIVQSLNNVIAMDINFGKIRFLRRHAIPVAQGSAFALPFKDQSFDCLISSEVIEHVPLDDALFTEMRRVLKPGATLIIGTPDYATIGWRTIEPIYGFVMPWGYKDEHITHYTHASLQEILKRHGFNVEETAYVAGSEMILRCRMGAPVASAAQVRELARASA
jgi:glycosyltransferase involved in cell wall biosynthesis